MSRRIRVLIADDHAATRVGLRRALACEEFDVCAEVADGSHAVSSAEEQQPDLCLLDIDMPGGGIQAAGEIKARRPATTIVMLTDRASEPEFFEALRAGASGYLLKSMDSRRLTATLRDAHEGVAAIPRNLVTPLVDAYREPGEGRRLRLPDGRRIELSRRESEVLDLLDAGQSTSAIAARLSLSPVTVRRHVSALVDKLGVPDRTAAVRLLREQRDPADLRR